MKSFAVVTMILAAGLVPGTTLATPPSYTAVDIINWNAQQLGTLPFFKHYSPLPAPNPPTDFHFIARTSSDLVVGNTWNVFTGPDQRGVLLTSTGSHTIDSFGDFHWWRTSPPSSATYRLTNALDVNWAGKAVGWANVPGTSESSSQGPDVHAITYDIANDKVDILPDARYGYANCINNRGEIAGHASGGPGPIVGGFRRSPDGQFTLLDSVPPGYHVQPLWINAQGVVIGMSVPGAWASAEGSATTLLPKLFNMPLATVTDVNDAGWIVGTSESWDHTEHYATLWEPNGDGTWTARDLADLVSNLGVLLFKASAINSDGSIVAVGQLDNGDASPTGIFLLTPSNDAATSCVPDIGLHPASTEATCGTGVSFGVQVANPNAITTYQWNHDGAPVDGSNASAHLPTLVLSSPVQGDAGSYECVVTNACGSSTSNPAVLTIGGSTCCPADLDNGSSTGTRDGGIDINDLLYFLLQFEAGTTPADLDNGTGTGTPDGGVDINDLLFFLVHFEAGC